MNAEGIFIVLGGKPKTGGGYMCHCPAHDDKIPSLSLDHGDNGKPIFKCMSGCSSDAVIAGLKEKGAWHSDSVQQLSQAELKTLRENAQRRTVQRIAEDEARHEGAAIEAAEILKKAKGNPAQHPYVTAKGLPVGGRIKRGDWPQGSYNDPRWRDALLIPLYDRSKKVYTISAITPDGEKKLLKGGKKTGCFHPIGKITGASGILVIGEGLATVTAVCKVMDCPGVVAIDVGNLEPVAREIRKLAPDADIVIIADDDQKPDTDSNPGKTAAIKAALAVAGRVAVPDLKRKADAWDVWHEQGDEGIRTMMAAATVAPVATVAVADDNLPNNTLECDLSLEPEDIQKLRGAMKLITTGTKFKRHTSAEIIGWGLRHVESGIQPHVGAALCSEWDKLTGGRSLEIFTVSDPNYHCTQPVTTASIYALAKQQGWTGQLPWTKPLPLIIHQQADPYPLQALPGTIGAAVSEVVAFVQCPVALGACSALAVVSLVGQGLVDVQRASRLYGPTSLYFLAIADSGERKSSVDGYFKKPIEEWDAEQAEAAKPDLRRFETESQTWEAKKSGMLAAIKERARTGKDTGNFEQEIANLEMEKPEPPKVPRLLFSDATPEALTHRLAHGWPIGGVLSSEAGIVFGGHAMGKESAMRNMAMLNSLWGAEPLTVDRRSCPSYAVRGARLTMGLAVQPETVRAFLDSSKGLARGIGWLARFLIAWPESTQGNRMYQDPPEHWPHLAKFHRRLGALLDLPLPLDEKGELAPIMLELSPEAKAVWVAFHDEVEEELRPGRDMAEARDVASKAADNCARMAALFHLFENDHSGAIGPDHMQAAASLVTWHLYEARRFMGEIALPIELNNAVKLDDWLLEYCRLNKAREVTTRTIQQMGPACTRDKRILDNALEELAEAGHIQVAKDGRRKVVKINPALLGGEHGTSEPNNQF